MYLHANPVYETPYVRPAIVVSWSHDMAGRFGAILLAWALMSATLVVIVRTSYLGFRVEFAHVSGT